MAATPTATQGSKCAALVLASIALWARPDMRAAASDLPVADMSAQVMAKQTFEYDPNPLLLIHGRKTVEGSVTAPELVINDDSPTSHADLDNRVEVNRFNLPGFSSTDLHSTGHLTTHGQTWQSSLAANVDYDTTRTSETAASGINIAGIRHTGLGLQPQFALNVSQLDQIQMNGSYARNLYGDKRFYTNYETFGVSPTYQHSFSPLGAGQVLVQAGRYQSLDGAPITIDNVGPGVGWIQHVSPRLSASAFAGAQEMLFHYGPGVGLADSRSLGYTFAVNASFDGQQDHIQFNATRQPTPNGNGTEAEATTVTLSEAHWITTRLEADMSASYQWFEYTGGLAALQGGLQQTYVTAAPKLLYHLTANFSVDLSYQFRRRTLAGGQSAQTNAAMVNFTFTPTAMRLPW